MWCANNFQRDTLRGLAQTIGEYHAENELSEPVIDYLTHTDLDFSAVSEQGLNQFQECVSDWYADTQEIMASDRDYKNECSTLIYDRI